MTRQLNLSRRGTAQVNGQTVSGVILRKAKSNTRFLPDAPIALNADQKLAGLQENGSFIVASTDVVEAPAPEASAEVQA